MPYLKKVCIDQYCSEIESGGGDLSNVYTKAETDALLGGKADTYHASQTTDYGLGTLAEYGHVKLVNDTNKSTYADGEALSAYVGYLLNQNKENLVEYSRNGLRRYWKFSGGTLICANTIEQQSVPITTSWGSIYESTSKLAFGDWLHAFVGYNPMIADAPLMPAGGSVAWIYGHGGFSLTSAGSIYVGRATSSTQAVVIDTIGIGRWK